MLIFSFLAALFFHLFRSAPADQAMMAQVNFMKNPAIMGTMLYVMTYEPRAVSIGKTANDHGLAHKRAVVMTAMTRDFFRTLPRNILRSFWGRNLLWHLLAIGVTLLIVNSGFDWMYFKATRPFAPYLFPAVILGGRVPVVFPIASYIVGSLRKDLRAICSAYSTAQAALIGLLISSFYKAFTGRSGLRHSARTLIDTSREFHFGFLKGGVFFGWPSSHTTVAFAMAAAIWTLYPGSKVVQCIALLYALYIGVGVSMTIHWFSDFVAGAIIGAAIGMTVGNLFKEHLLSSTR